MNSNELLDLIGEARTNYIQQALDTRSAAPAGKKRIPRKRALLIAAAIAAALLLFGCAVAVVSSLQNRKMGETTYRKFFDNDGNRIVPTEVTSDVVFLYGTRDTPQYKALKEWDAWNESYSPDFTQISCENDQGIPENLYSTYGCYTWEMADKLTEILDKYNLKPLDTGFVIAGEDMEAFCKAYSIDGFYHEDSSAQAELLAGWGYTCGAMELTWNITPSGGRRIMAEMEYIPKDYFATGGSIAVETETFEEWEYTTADGSPVQLALGSDRAFIFRQQENANIFVILYGDKVSFSAAPIDPFTREELEQAADTLNLQIAPQPPADAEGFKAQMQEAENRRAAKNEEESAGYQQKWEAMHSFDNYTDYLAEKYADSVPNGYYALWDLDGDGTEELLYADSQGIFYNAETIQDGKVVKYYSRGVPFQVCKDGILELQDFLDAQSAYRYYAHSKQDGTELESVIYRINEDQWYHLEGASYDYVDLNEGLVPITQAEAEAIRAKYPRVPIPVQPLKDYPVDDQGTTLEAYITRDWVPTTEEDALEIYREFLKKAREDDVDAYTHYRLQDLNGDGIPELFVGKDENHFDDIYKAENGKPVSIFSFGNPDSQICDGDIYRCEYRNYVTDSYTFWKMEGDQMVQVDYVKYRAETDLWGRSTDGDIGFDEILTKEQAQAVLDSYKIIPGCMKPLSEFPAK